MYDLSLSKDTKKRFGLKIFWYLCVEIKPKVIHLKI